MKRKTYVAVFFTCFVCLNKYVYLKINMLAKNVVVIYFKKWSFVIDSGKP